MADYGLAALAGLLGGGGTGLYKGYSAGIEDQQKAATLAENARQFNKSRVTDLSALGQLVPGLANMGEVPTAIAPGLVSEAHKQAATQADLARGKQFGDILGQHPDESLRNLSSLGAVLGQEKLTPIVTEYMKSKALETQGTPHLQPTDTGIVNVITNKKGQMVGQEDTGLKPMGSKSALNAAITAFQENPSQANLDRMNMLASQVVVPTGGTTMPKSTATGIAPTTPATPSPAGPTTLAPGVTRNQQGVITVPANAPETAIKDAGDRNNIITQLEQTSNLVRQMPQLQDWKGRGSLAIRGKIQGMTPFETVTPEEQAYIVTHENLRQLLIQAQMGLGPFRSPEMQRQLKDTIGRYWTPGTDERLWSLAQLLRGQQGAIGEAEQRGNQKPAHQPPPPGQRVPTMQQRPAQQSDPMGIR